MGEDMGYEYEEFKQDIYKLIKINLSLYKEKQMKRRIEALMTRKGYHNFYDFFQALKSDSDLLSTFVNYLTINVSEFYRNPEQWERFENVMIPQLLNMKTKDIHIWSAACSTGDEPYTIAMILSKYVPLEQLHILATDIDENVLAFAKRGIYNKKSIDKLPREFLDKFFTHSENEYCISEDIKKCVEFKKHNLLEDRYPSIGMNMIVCRNVVIYFTDEAKSHVYNYFYKTLIPNGILFIGSTEQLIHASEIGFTAMDYFFYQKKVDP